MIEEPAKTSKELHAEWAAMRAEERHRQKLEATRRWRAENPDKIRAYHQRDDVKAHRREYEKSEKCKEMRRRIFERDKEKIYARHAKYRNTKKAKTVAKAYYESFYADPLKRIHHSLCVTKNRCKKDGVPFDDAIFDSVETAIPTNCECCGVPIAYTSRDRNDPIPSIDRVDNRKGYIVGNVHVVCTRCNRLKDNGSIKDFENILAYMKAHIAEADWVHAVTTSPRKRLRYSDSTKGTS